MSGELKLYVTLTSPYARFARIIVREKRLQDRVAEIVAQTRMPGSPYYAVNPSGRVPSLVLPDGRVMEDSRLICDYLDALDGAPALARPGGPDRWLFAMAEARARSLLDGLAVAVRERYRPESEQSPGIIAHELARARRLLSVWEGEADGPLLSGPFNLVQMVLACAVEVAGRVPELDPRAEFPRLSARMTDIAARPSLVRTAPPPR